MSTEEQRFSRWRAVDAAPDGLPSGPAVLQAKVVGRLLRYPSGQSAMVAYGDCAACAVDGPAWAASVASAYPDDAVVWRYQPAPDPARAVARLRDAFALRFGGLPACDNTRR